MTSVLFAKRMRVLFLAFVHFTMPWNLCSLIFFIFLFIGSSSPHDEGTAAELTLLSRGDTSGRLLLFVQLDEFGGML